MLTPEEAALSELGSLIDNVEDGLTGVLEKERSMLDAWMHNFLQFQMHFWSATGREVITLQSSAEALAGGLEERGIDPSNSEAIMGPVKAETVVASPGWGVSETEEGAAPRKEEKGVVGTWFDMVMRGGGEGSSSESREGEETGRAAPASEHKWLQGMFRRRNVDFFAAKGGAALDDDFEGDVEAEESGSRGGSATGSATGSGQKSRRTSEGAGGEGGGGDGGQGGVEGMELKKKIEGLGSKMKGFFGGGAAKSSEIGNMNGLLGGEVERREKGAGGGAGGGGSSREGEGGGRHQKNGTGIKDMFSVFASQSGGGGRGNRVGGNEWNFSRGAANDSVAFDASEDV